MDTFQPGGLTFLCHIFLPFHTFHGVLTQEYWSGLPFPPLVDHILSELSTMTHLSWVALHGMSLSFIELQKPLFHNYTVIPEGEAFYTDHLIYSLPNSYKTGPTWSHLIDFRCPSYMCVWIYLSQALQSYIIIAYVSVSLERGL